MPSDPLRPGDQAVDGRAIGRRAQITRRRLLDETARLLELHGVVDLKVVEVSRAAGTSSATFYQYFTDMDDAILALAAEAGERERALLGFVTEAWVGADGRDLVRDFIDRYHHFWSEYRGVLRVRNLKAEEGDPRYQRIRSRSSIPMAEALGALVHRDGEFSGLVPFATGGAMLGMIERLFAYEDVFARKGTTLDDLKSTLTTILVRTLVDDS